MEDKKVMEIPIENIVPNPYQPRKVFSQAALEELSNSIKVYGILQPITVRQKDDKYELIAGERRFRAAKLLESYGYDCLNMNTGTYNYFWEQN